MFNLTYKTVCIYYSDRNKIQTYEDSQLPSIVNLNYLLSKLWKGERAWTADLDDCIAY